jgi:hypothetical protein
MRASGRHYRRRMRKSYSHKDWHQRYKRCGSRHALQTRDSPAHRMRTYRANPRQPYPLNAWLPGTQSPLGERVPRLVQASTLEPLPIHVSLYTPVSLPKRPRLGYSSQTLRGSPCWSNVSSSWRIWLLTTARKTGKYEQPTTNNQQQIRITAGPAGTLAGR